MARRSALGVLVLTITSLLQTACGAGLTARVAVTTRGGSARAEVGLAGDLGGVLAGLATWAAAGADAEEAASAAAVAEAPAMTRPAVRVREVVAATGAAGRGDGPALAEMPDFATIVVDPPPAAPAELGRGRGAEGGGGRGGGPGGGVATIVVDPPLAAGIARGVGAGGGDVAAESRLVDLVGAGVLVSGRRVALAGLERARLDWGRAGGEAWAVTFGEGGPVLGGATVVGGLPGWGDDEAAIVVALAGAADAAPAAPRRRVHLVVDGSDSMRAAWPELVAAVAGLVRALDPADVLQVVAYGSRAREVVAAVPVGDGRAALAALGAVEPSGHTNLEAGLRLAYDAIRARRRTGRGAGEDAVVILLSDGVPNVGAFGPAAVGRVVAEAREELGCVTAAVGMGQGFDGAVLRAVAVEGRGGFHVASSVAALVPALTGEGATAGVAARQVDVRIEPAAGVELLGPVGEGTGLVVEGGRAVWRLPVLRAGEERRVVVRARVPAWLRAASPGALTVSFAAAGGAAAHEVALRPAVGVEAAGAGSVAALDDVALAAALARAAAALRVADAESGAAALREWAAGGRATGRRAAAADVAAALAALGAAAPDADRALVAHAMTGLALRVGR